MTGWSNRNGKAGNWAQYSSVGLLTRKHLGLWIPTTYYGSVILFQDFSLEDRGLGRAPSHNKNVCRITKAGVPIMHTGNVDCPYIKETAHQGDN